MLFPSIKGINSASFFSRESSQSLSGHHTVRNLSLSALCGIANITSAMAMPTEPAVDNMLSDKNPDPVQNALIMGVMLVTVCVGVFLIKRCRPDYERIQERNDENQHYGYSPPCSP